MSTKRFAISSGHGKLIRGASGYIDEVDEARRVVNRVYDILTTQYDASGAKFHDDTSRNQATNLATITKFHNAQARDLDISVHFNAASAAATGTECLHYGNHGAVSAKMSAAMSKALGIVNRGAKVRKDLYVLKNTAKPAILLEVCFVSNKSDAAVYKAKFEQLCEAVAGVIADYIGAKKKSVAKVETAKSPSAAKATKKHKVVKGDTLYAIARKYGVTVDAIKKLNGLASNTINVGMTLKIK